MISRTEAKPTFHHRQMSHEAPPTFDTATIMGAIYGDGFLGRKDAFSRGWVQQLGEDIDRIYQDALKRPGGTVGRGRNRHYVEIHPENISGFVELVSHPWVTAVCTAILG